MLFALRPRLPRWTESRPRDYIVVVDASQSMVGERYARASRLVSAMIAKMDRRDRISVMACDADCRLMDGGELKSPSATRAREVAAWLESIQPAGASFLAGSLRQAARLAQRERETWVMYVGDGMSSTGPRRAASVATEVARMAKKHNVSISTAGIGADADAKILGTIARSGGGHFVPYTPGETISRAALSVLETSYGVSLRNAVVKLPAGIAESAPGVLPTVRAGDEILIAGRLSSDQVSGDVILTGTVGGEPYENRFPVELTVSSSPGNAFVPRMWASLMIGKLEQMGRGEDRKRIIALSKAYGVLSQHTSLLVLESEAMFRAFGVDRAQPTVRWTGEEEAESVASAGAIDYDSPADSFRRSAGKMGKGSAPRTKSKGARSSKSAIPLDPECINDPLGCGKGGRSSARRRRARARPRGRLMKRVWFRTASISRVDGVHPNIEKAIERAESALARSPDSREKHRALVQALSYGGNLDRAYEVASSWLERDRLDPQALVYMADILGRSGHRDQALRLLSGVVDLAPESSTLHRRLARAYQRIGAAEQSCAHHVALAEIVSSRGIEKSRRKAQADVETIAAAVRCQRILRGTRGADETLLGLASEPWRARVGNAAAGPAEAEEIDGELVLFSTWAGGADVDLTIVTPRGKRYSWMGGPKAVLADNTLYPNRERLALPKVSTGKYLIEVSRAHADDRAPVNGHIEVKVLGKKQRLPFSLAGDRQVVGRITVRRDSRLEPISGPRRVDIQTYNELMRAASNAAKRGQYGVASAGVPHGDARQPRGSESDSALRCARLSSQQPARGQTLLPTGPAILAIDDPANVHGL